MLPTDTSAGLPVATLDHIVVNVRDRMGAAAEVYRRLGFTLTPQGRHTLGSINHLAMFGTDYLELIGVPPEGAPGTDPMQWPEGLNGVVFGTDDSNGLYEVLSRAGAPVLPPLAFSRPVALPGGPRDAAFRTERVQREAVASGRLYFCHHLTRDLVWRDEWRRHANGVLGVAEVTIAAADPARLASVFASLFGGDAMVPIAGGMRLGAGLTSVDVLRPEAAAERFGDAWPGMDGRSEAMAGVAVRTIDPARAAAALTAGHIAHRNVSGAVRVAAGQAFGVALEFRGG